MNVFIYFLLVFISAYFFAKLEINIEGKNFWASNLPTWRRNSRFMELLVGKGKQLTGYHLNLFMLLLCLIHVPYLFIQFSLKYESLLLSFFIVLVVLEDFLWIALNPHYGLKKFNARAIAWHREWIGSIPAYYLFGLLAWGLLFVSSGLIR